MSKDKSNLNRLIIPFRDYERIYSIIYSVIKVGGANIPHSCMFFSIIGSLILNKHYKIPAQPVAGAFMLCIDDAPSVMCFGKSNNGVIASDKDNFHMWVQTKHHIIDFMAPIFTDAFSEGADNFSVARKMFQLPIAAESNSINDLSKPSDYFTLPNPDLSEYFVEAFTGRNLYMDLLMASDIWFKKPQNKLEELSLKDEQGRIQKLSLNAPLILGKW